MPLSHLNIKYFLEHSKPNEGLIVAGSVEKRFKHDRIHYVGQLSTEKLFSLYKASKYFLHLAWLDHCPNVVVDAKACGSQIVCSSAGGTKEVAGKDAVIIQEEEWDFEPTKLYEPPKMDFLRKIKNENDIDYDMQHVGNKYKKFIESFVK